jgi:hypothetical protein
LGNSRIRSQVGRESCGHRRGRRVLSKHTKFSATSPVGPSVAKLEQQGAEAPNKPFLFWQAQIDAVQAPCCGNLRATWRVLAPRQSRLIAPLSSRQGRDALGVPAVRRMCAIDLPRLEGNPAVEVTARNRTGPSKGGHRTEGFFSDGVCWNALLTGSSMLELGGM